MQVMDTPLLKHPLARYNASSYVYLGIPLTMSLASLDISDLYPPPPLSPSSLSVVLDHEGRNESQSFTFCHTMRPIKDENR